MPTPPDRPPSPPERSTPTGHLKPHHHGNLRAAALDALDQLIRDEGVGSVTLRTLAARTGVSHTALLHHFGTLHGLFTAFACAGFDLLGDRLARAGEAEGTGGDGEALDIGVEYVAFSVDHPAHFRVMFDPALLVADDAALTAARDSAFTVLRRSVDKLDNPTARSDAAAAIIAGWSLMHGLAVLSASGNLEAAHIRHLVAQDDLLALARRAGGMLFGSPGG